MKVGLFAGLILVLSGAAGGAQEMRGPRIVGAPVDWSAALDALSVDEPSETAASARPLRARANRSMPPALARLNAAMGQRFPALAQSPVPVLLPFDTDAYLRDRADGAASDEALDDGQQYLSGFHARTFFFAGPSGYDAAFALLPAEVPELDDIKFPEPIQIHISGSVLLYELDHHPTVNGVSVPALEPDFPGIRRMIHEHHLRFTFVRHGAPYVVSVGCFDAPVSRYKLPACRAAERVAVRFLRALRIAGGTPQPMRAPEPLPIERPDEASRSFSYHGPGRLLAGTGFRGEGGRADRTVYSQIRFPLADEPSFVNSQMFGSRNKPIAPGVSANHAYPWRDNFCERRGFPVGQCPAGVGHQGQDLRPALCQQTPGNGRCPPHNVVAVRDGAILRAPKQEALYLVVNTAREHVRFRYLHMHPGRMDADDMLSGRRVNEAEVIGQVSNFHKREGGTSYHLHFDLQVPTRNGWVSVNPYMTLVAAYERLIGARGEEIGAPLQVANADPATTAGLGTTLRTDNKVEKRSRYGKRHKAAKHKTYAKHKKRKKHRLARY